MPRLEFTGYSDDTFGEYSHFKDDYDCCASGALIVYQLRCGDERMNVVGQYAGKGWPDDCPGCWLIGVQQAEEGVPIPKWPISFEEGAMEYSTTMVIEAPDGVEMKCLNRMEDDDE